VRDKLPRQFGRVNVSDLSTAVCRLTVSRVQLGQRPQLVLIWRRSRIAGTPLPQAAAQRYCRKCLDFDSFMSIFYRRIYLHGNNTDLLFMRVQSPKSKPAKACLCGRDTIKLN